MSRFILGGMSADHATGRRRAGTRRGRGRPVSGRAPRSAPSETDAKSATAAGATSQTWTNWARTVSAHPGLVLVPADAESLADAVREAADSGLRVRAVGAGHSFTAAAVTDGLMLRLDRLCAVEAVVPLSRGGALVTVGAGIRLHRLNQELAARGLALPNLGDIDRQTISGAISTGTHGTGIRLGGLASLVTAVRVALPDGGLVEADRSVNPELFHACRLGLGVTGILVSVTLACVSAFALRAVEAPMLLDEVLERLDGADGLVEGNEHFEFYWFPHTRNALTKQNNRPRPGEESRPLGAVRGWIDDQLLANGVFELTNRLAARCPGLTPRVNVIASRALSARTFTAPSYEVFTSPRRVVFREMEYAVPRAALAHVLGEVERWLASSGEYVSFPVEIRFAAADDVWLSTAYERETAYVAVHQYRRIPYQRYFAAVEAIMGEVDGRPHWGKLNNLDAGRMAELYPRFEDFRAVRHAVDPHGVFANAYTDRVLGMP
jgi:FAD-linked oxidoreductase